MTGYGWLLIGVSCAWIGGDLFVRGIIGLSLALRVSAGIVGATVAAFATSTPELSVGVNAALAGDPRLSLGDTLGSNVANIAFILAIPIVISGAAGRCRGTGRDLAGALLTPLLIGVLAADGRLSRPDGLVLLGAFALWLGLLVCDGRRDRGAAAVGAPSPRGGRALLLCLAGLPLLIVAGRLIVLGARGIALSFGVGEFAVGATAVAVGTSVPELATTLIAASRGNACIGQGMILGSNIFNGLFIVAVVALIAPFPVDPRELAPALGFGVAAVLLIVPGRGGRVGRGRGALLLALYVAYVVAVLRRG